MLFKPFGSNHFTNFSADRLTVLYCTAFHCCEAKKYSSAMLSGHIADTNAGADGWHQACDLHGQAYLLHAVRSDNGIGQLGRVKTSSTSDRLERLTFLSQLTLQGLGCLLLTFQQLLQSSRVARGQLVCWQAWLLHSSLQQEHDRNARLQVHVWDSKGLKQWCKC